jgi:hypothetical protein
VKPRKWGRPQTGRCRPEPMLSTEMMGGRDFIFWFWAEIGAKVEEPLTLVPDNDQLVRSLLLWHYRTIRSTFVLCCFNIFWHLFQHRFCAVSTNLHRTDWFGPSGDVGPNELVLTQSRAPSLVIMTDWFGPSSYGTTEPSGQHSFCAVSTFSCACFNMSFVQFQQLCVGLVLLFNIWFLLIQHCVPPSVSTFCLQSLNNSTVTGIWMASKVSLGPKISTKIHLDKTY